MREHRGWIFIPNCPSGRPGLDPYQVGRALDQALLPSDTAADCL
ncbi:MAG TPA: hypothetical protein VFN75_05450 [Pseudonocardiaceae bacterium]|nr:hypothetical protein [Pseudonocardiaceae bacterium]